MVNDIRRAYVYAKIDRDVFIELPPEDPEYGSDKIGKLRDEGCSKGVARDL